MHFRTTLVAPSGRCKCIPLAPPVRFGCLFFICSIVGVGYIDTTGAFVTGLVAGENFLPTCHFDYMNYSVMW